jgi:hypothetical protein
MVSETLGAELQTITLLFTIPMLNRAMFAYRLLRPKSGSLKVEPAHPFVFQQFPSLARLASTKSSIFSYLLRLPESGASHA